MRTVRAAGDSGWRAVARIASLVIACGSPAYAQDAGWESSYSWGVTGSAWGYASAESATAAAMRASIEQAYDSGVSCRLASPESLISCPQGPLLYCFAGSGISPFACAFGSGWSVTGAYAGCDPAVFNNCGAVAAGRPPELNLGAPANSSNAAAEAPNSCIGNPINPATGNKFQIETDYAGSGPFPLRFSRIYNAQGTARTDWLGSDLQAIIGERWVHNYERYLLSTSGWANPEVIFAYRPDGRIEEFRRAGAGWAAAKGSVARLEQLGADEWLYTDQDDMRERYGADGPNSKRLLAIADRAGRKLTVNYDGAVVSEVVDDYGRKIIFRYGYVPGTGIVKVANITVPGGLQYRYEYDFVPITPGSTIGRARLARVLYPDETPGEPSDNPVRTYEYGSPGRINGGAACTVPGKARAAFLLTGLTDESGHRSEWSYDCFGWATESVHAPGALDADRVRGSLRIERRGKDRQLDGAGRVG